MLISCAIFHYWQLSFFFLSSFVLRGIRFSASIRIARCSTETDYVIYRMFWHTFKPLQTATNESENRIVYNLTPIRSEKCYLYMILSQLHGISFEPFRSNRSYFFCDKKKKKPNIKIHFVCINHRLKINDSIYMAGKNFWLQNDRLRWDFCKNSSRLTKTLKSNHRNPIQISHFTNQLRHTKWMNIFITSGTKL